MAADRSTVHRPFPVLPGLGGLIRGELTRWFGRRGLIHLVAWTVGIQGLLWWDTMLTKDPLPEWRGFELLIHLWWIACPLAGIAISQNALIEERQNDTMGWVLSKPVSRSSFVISKIISDAGGIIVLGVVLQGAVAWFWLPSVAPAIGLPFGRPDSGPYVAVVGIISLVVLFFVALTVLLTTVVPWRGPVAAVGLIIWIVIWSAPWRFLEDYTIGGLMTGEFEGATMKPIAEYLVFDQPLDPASGVLWTAISAFVFTIAAALIFRREQF